MSGGGDDDDDDDDVVAVSSLRRRRRLSSAALGSPLSSAAAPSSTSCPPASKGAEVESAGCEETAALSTCSAGRERQISKEINAEPTGCNGQLNWVTFTYSWQSSSPGWERLRCQPWKTKQRYLSRWLLLCCHQAEEDCGDTAAERKRQISLDDTVEYTANEVELLLVRVKA